MTNIITLETRQKRRQKQRRMALIRKAPLLVAVMVGILLLLSVYFLVILPARLTFATATNGSVTHDYAVSLLMANTETLVLAPVSGTPIYMKPDGSRFRRGEKIADIGKEEITAPIAGLYVAGKDGLEGILTPTSLKETELPKLMDEVMAIMPETASLAGGDRSAADRKKSQDKVLTADVWSKPQSITHTAANGVAGKMVNNLEPSWAFVYLPLKGVLQGDILQFRIGETTEKAYVERLSDSPCGVTVRFVHFLESSSSQRVLSADWIQKPPQQGVVVPASALVYNGEEVGIYSVEAGVIVYKNDIRVIDQNEDLACLEGLNAETRVVVNPRDGIAGKKAR